MQVESTLLAAPPRYECAGPTHAPAILALGGISADAHVCATEPDPRPGWWDPIAGAGRALDTTRYRLIGCDFLDGGSGPDGRPVHDVSTHDQADAIASVLDDLGVRALRALVGASYGGMVALAFAERYPERVERLVIISAAHRADPMSAARRLIQRQVVELGLRAGLYFDAMTVARALAMTTYRSRAEFIARFGPDLDAVESYLRHHGEQFARRVSPARFLALSRSADQHLVDPARITTPMTLVAAEHDDVVPRQQMAELASLAAGTASCFELHTQRGHDAFLTEAHDLAPILTAAVHSGDHT